MLIIKKILVVDDNKDVVFSIIKGLKATTKGYEFIPVYSGSGALKALGSEKIDLVLLDIMMPSIDGWQVVAEMKKNPKMKDIPIIYVTAKTDELSEKLGSLTGEDYIEKPFDIKDLKKSIEGAL